MKIFIMADMEGVSGICRSSQVRADGEHYAQGRKFLTQEVNACIEGCFDGGARQVTVRDAHGCGHHFLWDEVDARARIIQGDSPLERMPGIGSHDGLILLGYHAMGGTAAGILEHTFSSKAWQNLWMNGRRCGEIAVDAGIAGDHGVPTILVTGDDKTCREARKFLKRTLAVQVKTGLAAEGGILLAREPAHARIRKGAEDATKTCKSIPPFQVRSPVRLRLELVSRGLVPQPGAKCKVLDGRTYEVTAPSVEAALKALS